jgi:hypothetical protein
VQQSESVVQQCSSVMQAPPHAAQVQSVQVPEIDPSGTMQMTPGPQQSHVPVH